MNYSGISPIEGQKLHIREFSPKLLSVFITLYFSCIFLVPRVPGIPLRLEDLLFPLFLGVALLNMQRIDTRLLVPVLLYSVYIFLFSLLGVLFQKIDVRGLSVALKEFQYLVGFILVVGVASWNQLNADVLLKKILWVIALPALYGLAMILTNQIGYYGISSINERSPSLSGQMYFSAFVMSVIFYWYFQDKRIVYLSLALALCTLMVGSRTAAAMLLIFLAFFRLKLSPRLLAYVAVFFLCIYLIYVFADFYLENFYDPNSVVDRAIKRARSLFYLFDSLAPRFASWEANRLDQGFDAGSILFGHGRGYENMNPDGTWRGFELNVDSQYVRDILEIGLFGIVLKFLVVFFVLLRLKAFYFRAYLAYILAFLAAGITMELFNLSKPGALFWVVSAICLVCSDKNQKRV